MQIARRARIASVALALGVLGCAIVLASSDGRPESHAPMIVGAAASTRWPAESLEDWATFADQISTLTIVGERRLPLDERTKRIGEGPVGREVTAVIRSTLWAYDPARVVRGVIRFRSWGWVLHDGEFTPVVPDGEDRLEVGDEVLAPLMRAPEGEFAPIAPHTVLHLHEGRVRLGDSQARLHSALRELDQRSPEEVAELVASLEVDPRLRRLDPEARAQELASRRPPDS
ncbi:MAG: hypothetical protein KatS3mg012_2097 [Gaiellaceae bacterium]|jgi:hypothetical protein|nr:MAG: hypothetical protein KatS3mg012_2097 [Gaiellaceae bacterium]